MNADPLRIAFIIGSLSAGGAEKQLFYILRSLKETNCKLKIFSLTRGEYYEEKIKHIGLDITWIGEQDNPFLRLRKLVTELRGFHPDYIQSSHFFSNFYAGSAAPFLRATSIGAIRSNVNYEIKAIGKLGRVLLSLPHVLIANSETGLDNLGNYYLGKQQHFLLRNVIDIKKFDESIGLNQKKITNNGKLVVTTVANLNKVKRLDRFLTVIAALKKHNIMVKGIIVGEGPERKYLTQKAQAFGLNNEDISFLGMRSDVPYILSQSHIFILTSDHEGSPNAVLEAMTAGLPIIATPAGDCPMIVQHDINGFIVDYEQPEKMAEMILFLFQNQKLRQQMGTKSRQIIEENYNYDQLQKNLLNIYSQIPNHRRKDQLKINDTVTSHKKTSSCLTVNDQYKSSELRKR